MPWVKNINPTQEVLDELMHERLKSSNKPCHDCGVLPGEAHIGGCDTARCLVCGNQWLSCGCKKGEGDIWTGLWPGTISCYEYGLVCHWEGETPFKGWKKEPTFDYNAEAVLRLCKGHKKVCSFQEFLSRNNMLEKYARLRQTAKIK